MGWWEEHLAAMEPAQRDALLAQAAYEEELCAQVDEGLRIAVAAALERHGMYGIEEYMQARIRAIAEEIAPDLLARNDEWRAELRAKRKKTIPAKLRTEVFERDRYRCVKCGTHLDLRADHVIPESAGGPTTLENLQTLCAPCNSKKGTKVE